MKSVAIVTLTRTTSGSSGKRSEWKLVIVGRDMSVDWASLPGAKHTFCPLVISNAWPRQ